MLQRVSCGFFIRYIAIKNITNKILLSETEPNPCKKNYEQLKQYLHSEKAKPEKQILKSRELSMHTDENNIVTSYPNKDVQEERFVIRPKYRNIRIPRHRHEYIELSFMLDGEISMESMERPLNVFRRYLSHEQKCHSFLRKDRG